MHLMICLGTEKTNVRSGKVISNARKKDILSFVIAKFENHCTDSDDLVHFGHIFDSNVNFDVIKEISTVGG